MESTPTVFEFLENLKKELGFEKVFTSRNTYRDIDDALAKAQEGDQYSINYLLISFLPLIFKCCNQNYFKLKNPHTKQYNRLYITSIKSDEFFDLVNAMILRFYHLIKVYNGTSKFNYLVKVEMEWFSFNYRKRLNNNASHYVAIEDAVDSSLFKDYSKVTENDILDSLNSRENGNYFDTLKSSFFTAEIDRFIKTNFSLEDYYIYCRYFKDRLPIADIAIALEVASRATISIKVTSLKKEILTFLSNNGKVSEYVKALSRFTTKEDKDYSLEEKDSKATLSDLSFDLMGDIDTKISCILEQYNIPSESEVMQ